MENWMLNYNFTNSCKGIAILLIMLCHVCSIRVFTPLGGIGVALFLFCSGYGLNESQKKNGLSNYWSKKIKRVFIPYAIVICLISLFKTEFHLIPFLLDVLGIKTSYWYIAYLLKWYILFFVFTKWLYHLRMYAMLLVSLLMLFGFPELEAQQSFSFVVGVFASEKIYRITNLSRKTLLKIGGGCAIIGILFLCIKQLPEVREFMGTWIYNVVQCGIKLPLAISIMVLMTFCPTMETSKFILFTGTISYELYLVHFPFYGFVNHSIWRAMILIIGSYIVAYLFYKINNKIARLI